MWNRNGFKSFLMGLLLASLCLGGTLAHAEAMDFELPDIAGKKHRLSDYRGKWVVVNYWATWCPPCLTEIPELQDFHDSHANGDAVVLGINFEDIDPRTLQNFVEDYFISYPVLREMPGRSSVMGGIPGLPTTFVISPEGEILARQVGGVTAEMLDEFISERKQERSVEPAVIVGQAR